MTTCSRLDNEGVDRPCGTLIHVLQSVGLTVREDGGGGGGGCSDSSMTSPASLDKRRNRGAPPRAAMVPDLGSVISDTCPLASGHPTVVAGPFTLEAKRGGPDDGENRDLLWR
jgi:hypothetical protein